jgi:hypothetical protein
MVIEEAFLAGAPVPLSAFYAPGKGAASYLAMR